MTARVSLVRIKPGDAPSSIAIEGIATVGRALDATVRLPEHDKKVSRYHAILQSAAQGLVVNDLNSRNGTFVNGARISGVASADQGDVLRFGVTEFRVELAPKLEVPAVTALDTSPYAATQADDDVGFALVRRATLTVAAPEPLAETRRFIDPRKTSLSPIIDGGACIACDTTLRDDGPSLWPDAGWICRMCAARRRDAAVPSRTLGGFELLRFMKQGGSAAVYEAREARGGAHGALKILQPMHSLTETDVKRFLREHRVFAELDHPAIVRFLAGGLDKASGDLFIVSEFVGGGESGNIAHSRADVRTILAAGADLFEALAYAHGRGLVHRDVKPGNVLLTYPQKDGRQHAKLADFGLAKSFGAISGATAITREGEAAGSPCFMAPEQLVDFRGVRESADLYSAGVTLYYWLTATIPLDLPMDRGGATMALACSATLDDKRIPLRERRAGLPEPLYPVIDALVARRCGVREEMSAPAVASTLRRLAGP